MIASSSFAAGFRRMAARPFNVVVAATVAAAFVAAFGVTAPASAGSLHFVGPVTTQVAGNEVVITGKIAGLGNGDITYEVEVDAELTIYLVDPERAEGQQAAGAEQGAAQLRRRRRARRVGEERAVHLHHPHRPHRRGERGGRGDRGEAELVRRSRAGHRRGPDHHQGSETMAGLP